MTQQIAIRLPDDMWMKLERYVAEGLYANRTAAVHAAIQALIDHWEAREIAEAYRRAYTEQPEDEDLLKSLDKLAGEALDR
jgi:Arc/MetJ-type ribon-helix-helix transcriptional regulator